MQQQPWRAPMPQVPTPLGIVVIPPLPGVCTAREVGDMATSHGAPPHSRPTAHTAVGPPAPPFPSLHPDDGEAAALHGVDGPAALAWQSTWALPLAATFTVPTVVILRALSGSGKSTLSRALAWGLPPTDVAICSADNYFTAADGAYRFDRSRLGAAHASCRDAVWAALWARQPLVIIDNTNTVRDEYAEYEALLQHFNGEIAGGRAPPPLPLVRGGGGGPTSATSATATAAAAAVPRTGGNDAVLAPLPQQRGEAGAARRQQRQRRSSAAEDPPPAPAPAPPPSCPGSPPCSGHGDCQPECVPPSPRRRGTRRGVRSLGLAAATAAHAGRARAHASDSGVPATAPLTSWA